MRPVSETTVEGWQQAFQSMNLFGPEDGDDAFFGAVLLYDEHLLDLYRRKFAIPSAVKIVDSELCGCLANNAADIDRLRDGRTASSDNEGEEK